MLRALLAAVALGTPLLASAQAVGGFPIKPIRLVVPYSAGGGADSAARIIAAQMTVSLKQQVVIDNRPGASGTIGAAAVAQAPADGYVVLYDASTFVVNPALRKLPFDPMKDFIPVSLAVTAPNILVVPPGAPYRNVAEFLDAARKRPGRITYASYGPGSPAHMVGELLKSQAKVDLLHVPYKGGAPALADVMGGQVDAYFANAASGITYVKGGKLRALAVTSSRRMPALPDVPTLVESGLAGFDVLEWNGFFVPKGTPPQVVERLAGAVSAAINDPKVNARLIELGVVPVGSPPDAFGKFLHTELARWAKLVKDNRITVE
ncbi:tripartite tricarboxylate transporter substrate binding protein [Cupriavidus basilensis]|uniref:Tripartite tricarboxylate transporter substrate binding protein n=1 Tax=Cupriavidus basilensis TaxID=68895 RepID=A0ABT6AL04_9BURK|nr:tripartite tricarboxylate transporter substrate binding protein [Cupriavidus basilensis]MDF3832466.1 tripartite tricarboxylate transporter substrate binding protein [Cupriavidus basilensis]